MYTLRASIVSGLAMALLAAAAAAGETANAEANRKKPLQRCDQLNDKAEIDCLQKARERIVQARQKRETSGKGSAKSDAPAKTDASAKTDAPAKADAPAKSGVKASDKGPAAPAPGK